MSPLPGEQEAACAPRGGFGAGDGALEPWRLRGHQGSSRGSLRTKRDGPVPHKGWGWGLGLCQLIGSGPPRSVHPGNECSLGPAEPPVGVGGAVPAPRPGACRGGPWHSPCAGLCTREEGDGRSRIGGGEDSVPAACPAMSQGARSPCSHAVLGKPRGCHTDPTALTPGTWVPPSMGRLSPSVISGGVLVSPEARHPFDHTAVLCLTDV